MQLTKLVVGLSLALGFVATAAAQTTMRISISTAQNSHQGVAIDTFAKEVEKRTGGRYKVQTFYNGALGGERESIEAVQLGTQELAFSSSGPIPNFVPETKSSTCPSCSATRPMPARCSTAPSAKSCWPSSTPRASRPWPGQKTASAT
jgi:TRAP-type C4-dicarboxylate transport system substrate-binding protein